MTIPCTITAGDSLSFTESFASYLPDSGWSLKYVLLNQVGKIEFESSAVNGEFSFTVSSADSQSWTPGNYKAIPVLTNGSQRVTLDAVTVVVNPDPLAVESMDTRSQAQKILEALRVAYESFAKTGLVQEVSMNGRTTKFRNADDILKQINYWQALVNSEGKNKGTGDSIGFGKRILTSL